MNQHIKHIILYLSISLGMIIALEVGLRIIGSFFPSHYGLEVINYLTEKQDDSKIRYLPKNYQNYIRNPKWFDDGTQAFLAHKGDKKLIVTLGGSTTQAMPYAGDVDATWPAQLQQKLRDKLGADNIYVVNGGLGSATSYEMLLAYLFHYRHLEPDIVILHTGANDGAAIMIDNYQVDYSHFRTSFRLPKLRTFEKPLLKYSYIYRLLFLKSVNYNLGTFKFWMFGPNHDIAHLNKIKDNAVKQKPIAFERNIDILVRNILNDGARVVMMPVVFAGNGMDKKGLLDRAPKESRPMLWEARMTSNQKHVDILKAIAQKYEVTFLDFYSADIPNEYFVDHIHLNRQGQEIKAQKLTEVINDL